MRLAAPPVDGSVQMLPCMSIASVRPSGDTATDIDVPSETATSIGVRAGAAPRATRPIVASIAAVRTMIPSSRAYSSKIRVFPEGLMKRSLCSAFIAALVVGGAPLLLAQSKAKATNVPEIAYDSVPNFFKMPPNIYFGEGIGVATNSKGHVWVYTRSGETRLFEFDQNGNFVKEWGQGLYGFAFAHAVRVDPQDNVWAVDEGTNMVIKFNPQGRVVMVLGRRPEAVDELTNMSGSG